MVCIGMTWPNFGRARATGEVSMSLVKSPRMTGKNLAAHQLNGRKSRLSRGPATPQGRERVRAAHLVHGFYNDSNALPMQRMEDSNFRQVAPDEPAHEDGTPRASDGSFRRYRGLP
jgi:hypothetical protein